MIALRAIVFVVSALLTCLTAETISRGEDEGGKICLCQWKDLTGWTPYIWDRFERKQDTTTPVEKVWMVKDGVLACAGRPVGYLKTKAEYEDYKLELQWRWPNGRGNSGVLVHTSTPETLGLWPKSIEVQLYTNNAGDFWVIGTTLEVPDAENRRGARRTSTSQTIPKNRLASGTRWRSLVVATKSWCA